LSGLFGSLAAGHIGHDGGHFAISRKYPLLNDIGVWGFFLATNPITWQHQHTFAHHSFTNDDEKDPDLNHYDCNLVILPDRDDNGSKNSNGAKIFSLMYIEFGFSTWALAWWIPMLFVFERTYYGIIEWTDVRRWHRTVQLLLHWLFYAFTILCVPFIVQKNSKLAILQILLHLYTGGILFSFFTQVGHLADVLLNTTLIAEQRNKRHPIAQQSWAAEQIVSTQNFNPLSHYMFYLSTGLSLQIEHHLFPYMNHCHLMKIQPIVEQTCNEYNVTYTKCSTWTETWDGLKEYLTKSIQ
jgi:fatty acid desaturase